MAAGVSGEGPRKPPVRPDMTWTIRMTLTETGPLAIMEKGLETGIAGPFV